MKIYKNHRKYEKIMRAGPGSVRVGPGVVRAGPVRFQRLFNAASTRLQHGFNAGPDSVRAGPASACAGPGLGSVRAGPGSVRAGPGMKKI